MFCRKQKAILAIRICLLRQDISHEKRNLGENLTSFGKCYNCFQGKKIRMNPDPKLDKDVRKLMREYLPKPIKYNLVWKKPVKENLRKPIKYNLKGDNDGNS